MLELIADKDRLLGLTDDLKRDKFKPGYDNMDPKSLRLWIMLNYDSLRIQLMKGRYKPLPASGFSVAKRNGSFRTVCRICAIDSVIQKSILDVFGSEIDGKFSQHSHAYRKGKGVSTAIEQYCTYASCYRFVAKIDPCNCFDSIDHKVLRAALTHFTDNASLIRLIMSFAACDIIVNERLTNRVCGVLQGAPISSLLCNIYFDSLDKHLEEKQLPFIRYADDLVIFGNSYEDLHAASEMIKSYMIFNLKLLPNADKCSICPSNESTYLGQTFFADKSGRIGVKVRESTEGYYYRWFSHSIKARNRPVTIISDGILTAKDFALAFLSDSDDSSAHIPVVPTDTINVYSNAVFDSGSIEKAFKNGISINIFDKYGNALGSFIPETPIKDTKLLIEQILTYQDIAARLNIAREFVLSAAHHMLLVIRYYYKHDPISEYSQAIGKIQRLMRKAELCGDYDALLLCEAQMRIAYFSCFDTILAASGFRYDKRTRKPPENEVNALISFGNTVLYSMIASEISKTALDVRIGYLHATNRRLKSLNLDISEVFKPLIVDRTIFSVLNRHMLNTGAHFACNENGAVWLNAEGKKIFVKALNDKLHSSLTIDKITLSYYDIIVLEIRKLIRRFRAGEEYKAFWQVR